jgi:signal transduction histidine kinase
MMADSTLQELVMQYPNSPTTGKPVLLCVDDEKNVLDPLQEMLKTHFGRVFKIEIAESGEEALELINMLKAKERTVAVIISDQLMPQMKGDEFLVKAHQILPNAVKIMLTGQASAEQVGNALNNANLFRFLAKPWDNTDMRLTVESAARSYFQTVTINEQNRVLLQLHEVTDLINQITEVETLVGELSQAILRFAEAERVMVCLQHENQWMLAADARLGQVKPDTTLTPLADTGTHPSALIRKVADTRKPLVLANAIADADYNSDLYIKATQARSVLVLPVLNVGQLVGIIYLEDNRNDYVFTPWRQDMVEVLANHAAIALDNAYRITSLEELIAERTRELVAVNSHKDEMIRIVSHDIRGPLSGGLSLADMLQDPDVAEQKDQVIKFGGIIRNSISQVIKLADDILDLAKMESGTILLTKSQVNLGKTLQKLQTTYQANALAKGIQLIVESLEPVETQVDENKVLQALGNLVSNSIKFTQKGSVTMRLSKTTESGQSYARIEIIDTGVGIPPEALPKIFDRFGSFQRSGTQKEKGTGLGMSIALEVIQLHGGRIDVASEVGKGTTFTVLLPL